MTTIIWSTLEDGQELPFDPANDLLFFDDPSIDARVGFADIQSTAIDFFDGIKTVRFLGFVTNNITTQNVQFADGSVLIVGDNTIGVTADDNANVLIGTAHNDQLIGQGGNDYLEGRAGDDTLYARDGNDHLEGGGGADELIGESGFDYARYVYAPDSVTVDLGDPLMNTGDAAGDTYDSMEGVVGSQFDDQISGDAHGNDLVGLGGSDSLFGLAGDDWLQGGDGDDNLDGGLGADHLSGGAGNDTAHYEEATSGVGASLSNSALNTGEAAGDVFFSVENIFGSDFGDVLGGDGGANRLLGGAGNDLLIGLGADDLLIGDIGDDQLEGGAGADELHGDNGFDYARYDHGGAVQVDLVFSASNSGEAAGDHLLSIEGVVGSAAADTLLGNPFANDLIGLGGDDFINARSGNDVLQGGDGNDTLDGGADFDRYIGGAGNDTFVLGRDDVAGDVIVDFVSHADVLQFIGYGTVAQGASLTPVVGSNPSRWTINSSDGSSHDVIVIFNNAAIDLATDVQFI